MKKLLLVLLVSTLAFATGCQKESDPPAPEPVVTTTTTTPPPAPVMVNNWSGFCSNTITVIIVEPNGDTLYQAPLIAPTYFPIAKDSTYDYRIVCAAQSINATGTYGISSTTGLWQTEDAPVGITFLLGGTNNDEIGINKL